MTDEHCAVTLEYMQYMQHCLRKQYTTNKKGFVLLKKKVLN